MSAPIRAEDGCIIGTKYNRIVKPPFYMFHGIRTEETISYCPQDIHYSELTKYELKLPILGTVGYYVRNQRKLNNSCWIQITAHKYRKYFIFKDVYCKECDCWHFGG